MQSNKRIYIAGHNGMVGSALARQLKQLDNVEIITKTRNELDLTNQSEVQYFFEKEKIDEVYLAAAKVGGIFANNNYPASFIYENIMIESNIIHQAFMAGVGKLLFLGSSCIYPRDVDQPMSESALLTGVLESTNEPYAIAKIAGIKLCESYNRQYGVDYRSVMPTNLYGDNDNFHSENSHVIPALIRRFHDAKMNCVKDVVIWGTGKAKREFLHVDDMASASIHIMNLDHETYKKYTQPMLSHINVGSGVDCTIEELATLLKKVIGLRSKLVFDFSKPDGSPRKLMDVSRLNNLGWQAEINLEHGLTKTYNWFLQNQDDYRQ